MDLKKKNLDFFKKEGFLYIKNFFDKKLIFNINRSIIFSLNETLKKNKIDKKFINCDIDKKLIKLRKGHPKIFADFFDSLQTTASIYPPLVGNKVLKIIEKLLNVSKEYITLTDVGIRLDPPKDYRNVLEWHQDSSYYRQNNSGKNGIVVWSPLIHNISSEMGPLLFLKNSHNLGSLMTSKKKSKKKYASNKIEINFNKMKKYLKDEISLEINSGEALLMNLDMIHKSGNNLSNKFRCTLLARYHNSKSKDFNPGLNIYKYSNKNINKKVHGF